MQIIYNDNSYVFDNLAQSSQFVLDIVKQKLQESDYTQLPDSPFTAEQKSEWSTYREQVRVYWNDTAKQGVEEAFYTQQDFVVVLPTPPQQ